MTLAEKGCRGQGRRVARSRGTARPADGVRMRRVPYHQSVFDLLNIQAREPPQARTKRLPEAVRQWYLTGRSRRR